MQAQTPEDDHDLIVHLLHGGGSLWIPGAKPRNEPAPFTPPELPTTLQPHPLNPNQAPMLIGTIPALTLPSIGARNLPWSGPAQPGHYWYVALPHLAHHRGECDRCEPVWCTADQQWKELPDNETLFAAIELSRRQSDGSTITLLAHADDVPDDWS